MSDEYDVFKVEAKPEPKAKPEPEEKPDPDPFHNGMSREQIARVREDIYRMWHAEPEETR